MTVEQLTNVWVPPHRK